MYPYDWATFTFISGGDDMVGTGWSLKNLGLLQSHSVSIAFYHGTEEVEF